jgi:hypothetical protein
MRCCSLEADWVLNVTRVSVAQVLLRRAAVTSEPRFLRDTQWSWDDKPEGIGVVLFGIFGISFLLGTNSELQV